MANEKKAKSTKTEQLVLSGFELDIVTRVRKAKLDLDARVGNEDPHCSIHMTQPSGNSFAVVVTAV